MTVPRDETDAAFETVRAYLEDGTYAEHAKEIEESLTTIQDEMKRLQEERDAALQLVDDTVATLEATAE